MIVPMVRRFWNRCVCVSVCVCAHSTLCMYLHNVHELQWYIKRMKERELNRNRNCSCVDIYFGLFVPSSFQNGGLVLVWLFRLLNKESITGTDDADSATTAAVAVAFCECPLSLLSKYLYRSFSHSIALYHLVYIYYILTYMYTYTSICPYSYLFFSFTLHPLSLSKTSLPIADPLSIDATTVTF